MCLILSGKVGSNIASELGTMRVTQQIDALEIMGINSASYLILPKIMGLITIMPFLVIFSAATGIIGAYATAYLAHIITPVDLTAGLQHDSIVVYVDEYHQGILLCLYHFKCIVVYGLHGEGRKC